MRQQVPLLSVGEVALRFNQSEFTIRAKVRDGTLPAVRIGNGPKAPIRFDSRELDAWLYRASASSRAAATAKEVGNGD
jgi:excisionase family DNA binding protein